MSSPGFRGGGVKLVTIESAVLGKAPSLAAGSRGLDVSAANAVSLAALAIDALLIVLTSVVAGGLYLEIAFGTAGDLTVLLGIGAIFAAFFCALTRLKEAAEPLKLSSATARVRSAVAAWTMTFFFLVTLAFALKVSAVFSRGAMLSFFFSGLGVVVASRVYGPGLVARLGAYRGLKGVEPIVIASSGYASRSDFLFALGRQGSHHVHVIEIDPASASWEAERRRVVAGTFSIARAAGKGPIFIAAPELESSQLASLVQGLRLLPRAVRIVPDPEIAELFRHTVRTVGATLSVEMQREPMNAFHRGIKRSLDIAIASAAIFALAPVFLLVALLVKCDSPGPVIFQQCRNGLGGRSFRIFKFRTMRVMEDGDDVAQAVQADGRVTRLGRFLRRTSLDELPQFLNVLKGEMSLVGPRPHARAHDAHYAALIENYEIRQHVKPGLTGWAQVNGYRGETPTVDAMHRRIALDLWYASNASLALDFLVLVRTLPALMSQRNAW